MNTISSTVDSDVSIGGVSVPVSSTEIDSPSESDVVRQLQRATLGGTTIAKSELLGEVVTWDISFPEIGVNVVRDALKHAGLPDIAKDLNNRSAFSRATKHLKENRSIDKVKASRDGKLTFQLTKKSTVKRGSDDVIEFNYESQITIDTETGDIQSDDKLIESEARRLFTHALDVRTASDVTRMVQKLFKDHADLFPVNPTKGVAYFVPETFREFTTKVDTFLSRLNGQLWRFPVPKGTPQGNKSVQQAVQAGLQSVLDEINECVEGWDDTTRKDTMTRGIKRWKSLEHKARAYGDYLQNEQDGLLAKIDAAKQALVEKASRLGDESASTTAA